MVRLVEAGVETSVFEVHVMATTVVVNLIVASLKMVPLREEEAYNAALHNRCHCALRHSQQVLPLALSSSTISSFASSEAVVVY